MHMLVHCSCTCRTDVSRAALTCFVSIKEAALATGQIGPASGRSRSGRNPNSQQQLVVHPGSNPTSTVHKDRQSRNSTSLTCHIQLLAVLSRAEPLTPACGRVQIALSRPPRRARCAQGGFPKLIAERNNLRYVPQDMPNQPALHPQHSEILPP